MSYGIGNGQERLPYRPKQPSVSGVNKHADWIMNEIRKDQASGQVPRDVHSFSQLHDYVDANDYLMQASEQILLAGDEDPGPEPYNQDAHLNAVADEVDRRLK